MKNLVSILLLTGGILVAAPNPSPAAARIFRIKCAGCHGSDGAGGSGACLTGKLAHPTSRQLFEVIKSGIPGTAMPPSGLPDPMVKQMAAYVQFLSKRK
jgi:mono/diheme cytochrome c family protein